MQGVAKEVSAAARHYASSRGFRTVYVVTAGSAPGPGRIEEALGALRREIERQLVAEGLEVSANIAPRETERPTESCRPIRQPETVHPPPDVVLVVALDLTTTPGKLTFWFVSPEDYRATNGYGNPQDRHVLELK